MKRITLLATADVHSPRYLMAFITKLRELPGKPDLIIWAGDMVEKNNINALEPVLKYTREKFPETPIVSIFGNEEYRGYEEHYISRYRDIIWVNDSYVIHEVGDTRIGIIGTRGSLDKLTSWQARNMPWLQKYYRQLPQKILDLAKKLRRQCDIIILVSHYGVTYRNLKGEHPSAWPYLASKHMETIIKPDIVDIVIHGHAHKAIIEKITINNVPVYNVSFPAFNKIFMIVLEARKKGLLYWLGMSQ